VASLLVVDRWSSTGEAKAGYAAGLSALAVVLVVFAVGGASIERYASVPYNVKELMAGRPPALAAVVLALVIAGSGACVSALASSWRLDAARFAKVFPLCVLGAGSVAFVALLATVPLESLDDIVGTPVLGIGGTLERGLRFVALFVGPVAAMTLGSRLMLGALRDAGAGHGAGVVGAFMLGSWVAVVPLAATSNVVELLRGRGFHLGVAALAAGLIGLGSLITILARALVRARRRPLAVALAFAVVVLSVPVAWHLLLLGTNPRLEKYGQAFSAAQFLFSPSRDSYAGHDTVFMVFAATHVGLSVVLASGAALILPTTWSK
jgi:hypothetical protein